MGAEYKRGVEAAHRFYQDFLREQLKLTINDGARAAYELVRDHGERYCLRDVLAQPTRAEP